MRVNPDSTAYFEEINPNLFAGALRVAQLSEDELRDSASPAVMSGIGQERIDDGSTMSAGSFTADYRGYEDLFNDAERAAYAINAGIAAGQLAAHNARRTHL